MIIFLFVLFVCMKCSEILGCDGQVQTPDSLPVLDVCNVCNGNGTTCLGCDAIPYGKKKDQCGVCGGNGDSCYNQCNYVECGECLSNERCEWCDSLKLCTYTTKIGNYTCTSGFKKDTCE